MNYPQRALWRAPFYLVLSLLIAPHAWSLDPHDPLVEEEKAVAPLPSISKTNGRGVYEEIYGHSAMPSHLWQSSVMENLLGGGGFPQALKSLMGVYGPYPEVKQVLYQVAQAHPQDGKTGVYFYHSYMTGDRDFKVHDDGVIDVVDASGKVLSTFALPELSDPEQCQAWHMHLCALELASLAGHPHATQTLMWIRELGLNPALKNVQQPLGIAAFSATGDRSEAFKNWGASRQAFVFDRATHEGLITDLQRKVEFLRQHMQPSWWSSVMSSSVISEEETPVSFAVFKEMIGEAQKLAEGVMDLTKGLFSLFSEEGLETWSAHFIAQRPGATPEERQAEIRQMMLMIHELPRQAYWTFSRFANFVKPDDIAEDSAENLERLELLFKLFDTIAGDCHWNPDLLAAQTARKETAGPYAECISSLWKNLFIYGGGQLAHPLLATDYVSDPSTGERSLLDIDPVERFRRLARKSKFARTIVIPYLGMGGQWFASHAAKQSGQVAYLQKEAVKIQTVIRESARKVLHLNQRLEELPHEMAAVSQQASEMLLSASETDLVGGGYDAATLALFEAAQKQTDLFEALSAELAEAPGESKAALRVQDHEATKLPKLVEAMGKHAEQADGYKAFVDNFLEKQLIITGRTVTFYEQAYGLYLNVSGDLDQEERASWEAFMAGEEEKVRLAQEAASKALGELATPASIQAWLAAEGEEAKAAIVDKRVEEVKAAVIAKRAEEEAEAEVKAEIAEETEEEAAPTVVEEEQKAEEQEEEQDLAS